MIIPTIHLLGFALGIVLIGLNRRQSQTLMGSFFKKYYRLTILASALLAVGFLGEYFVLNQPEGLVDSLMHIVLLIAIVVYSYAIISWPKEAEKYLENCKKPQ
jgi:cytochrome bd-type quinol oxidase subunit 2